MEITGSGLGFNDIPPGPLLSPPERDAISSVFLISLVFHSQAMEIISAKVQAIPPSSPYEPPVSQSRPIILALNSGSELSLVIPLTGRPSTGPITQFHDQCSPSASHKLRVRKYATASQTPASAVLMNVNL